MATLAPLLCLAQVAKGKETMVLKGSGKPSSGNRERYRVGPSMAIKYVQSTVLVSLHLSCSWCWKDLLRTLSASRRLG